MSFYSILKWKSVGFSPILNKCRVLRHSQPINSSNASLCDVLHESVNDPGYYEDHDIAQLNYQPFYSIQYVGHDNNFFALSNIVNLEYVLYSKSDSSILGDNVEFQLFYHSFGKIKRQDIYNSLRISDISNFTTIPNSLITDDVGKSSESFRITGPDTIFRISGNQRWQIGDQVSRNEFMVASPLFSDNDIIIETPATINNQVNNPAPDNEILSSFPDIMISELNMSVDNGIVKATIPYDLNVIFEVAGSAGGRQGSSRDGYVSQRAEGAVIRAEFTIPANSNMEMIIGQMGHDNSSSSAGGSGGSFVVIDGEPLIIAGGGGGGGYRQDSNRGQLDTRGGVASGGSAQGGRDGNGGNHGGGGAAGGGGFLTDGGDSSTRAGKAFVNGGFGGSRSSSRSGGFGGGAANGSHGTGGPGGGGYSGGASGSQNGSPYSAIQTGGGGGSFIHESATNVYTSNGQWTTHGTEPHPVYTGSARNLNKFNEEQGYISFKFR